MAQVVLVQARGGVAGPKVGVLGGDIEEDLRAGVGADGLFEVVRELAEVLVGQSEREAVAAGLGEQHLQRVGQMEKVVRLVQIQGGVRALGGWAAGAAGGGRARGGRGARGEV
ncbi:hypothetical protein ADK76_21485, partial [Streptomyces griseoflavus]